MEPPKEKFCREIKGYDSILLCGVEDSSHAHSVKEVLRQPALIRWPGPGRPYLLDL